MSWRGVKTTEPILETLERRADSSYTGTLVSYIQAQASGDGTAAEVF